MLRVGLTGGIGSGKSTVAAALGRRGARVIDADCIARRLVEPGGAAFASVVERFGRAILGADGTLDRSRLAAIAFSDVSALADLNEITHPLIAAEVLERADELEVVAGNEGVVVLDQPLLTRVAVAAYHLDLVVVVDTPTETAVARLVRHRGFTEDDARARVASQIGREERLVFADLVVDNAGAVDDLEEQVERLWAELAARAG